MSQTKTEKMDPTAKTAWLKALRSGEYTQGLEALKRKNSETKQLEYCCLGVLKDVVPGIGKDSDGVELLSASSLKRLNISKDAQDHLANMNDEIPFDGNKHTYTFKRIAAWIEKHL